MLSYHNNKDLKRIVLAELEHHKKADAFRQGVYWEADVKKGCAVGCLVKPGTELLKNIDVHVAYESLFGIPQQVAWLEDCIFELMSVADSKEWPIRFMQAVPVGASLADTFERFCVGYMDWASDPDPYPDSEWQDYYDELYDKLKDEINEKNAHKYADKLIKLVKEAPILGDK